MCGCSAPRPPSDPTLARTGPPPHARWTMDRSGWMARSERDLAIAPQTDISNTRYEIRSCYLCGSNPGERSHFSHRRTLLRASSRAGPGPIPSASSRSRLASAASRLSRFFVCLGAGALSSRQLLGGPPRRRPLISPQRPSGFRILKNETMARYSWFSRSTNSCTNISSEFDSPSLPRAPARCWPNSLGPTYLSVPFCRSSIAIST
jgi:hypothetical protein